MSYQEAVTRLAPCGLDCSRCADYEKGEIKQLSQRLSELLNNYERVAKMKAPHKPAFENYAQFEEIVALFSRASCGGCRSENVQCPISCAAKTCHKEKGIDFCFQCDEYPCEKQFASMNGLRNRWILNNDRMKETGVVGFYEEQMKLPRY